MLAINRFIVQKRVVGRTGRDRVIAAERRPFGRAPAGIPPFPMSTRILCIPIHRLVGPILRGSHETMGQDRDHGTRSGSSQTPDPDSVSRQMRNAPLHGRLQS